MASRVILLVGCSGSGKSTYAREHFPEAVVVSADHYFEELATATSQSFEDVWDLWQLGAAHSQCQQRFLEAITNNAPFVVVDISDTEKEQLIKARRGQGTFRNNVERHEHTCRLTGLTDKRFLVASHVKPWAKCESNKERLDGSNGLFLAPHADKLFDGGWITFTDDGQILCACFDVEVVLRTWGIDPARSVGKFTTKQAEYLAYHRDAVFAPRQTKLKRGRN